MIKAIVCGYGVSKAQLKRCRDSIKMQEGNYELVEVVNEEPRKFLLENTCIGIARANPSPADIIVLIDADDFLVDERAFRIIEETYNSDRRVLLTHGTYVDFSTNERGKFNGTYLPGEDVRSAKWRGTHLKTFKYELFNKVPQDRYKRNGQWLECCADRAMMIPMMEVAGIDRVRYIESVLYCYDDTNPAGVWKTMKEKSKDIREWIKRRPSLQVENI